ncbi:hypothetical protein Gotur_018047 [Gossypium turneri]
MMSRDGAHLKRLSMLPKNGGLKNTGKS